MFVHCCWECNLVEPQWKRVWRVLKKLKIELPHNTAIPLLSIYLNKLKTLIWKDIHTPMFIGALFTTNKWNQPRCPVMDEYIKMWEKDNVICICIWWNNKQWNVHLTISTHQCKPMSKAYPLLFYESLESFNGAVITVQHQHGQRRQLGCSVPAITAVHHDWGLPGFYFISNSYCPSKKHLQKRRHIKSGNI